MYTAVAANFPTTSGRVGMCAATVGDIIAISAPLPCDPATTSFRLRHRATRLTQLEFNPMDLRKLKTLIDLVSESNISELEITEAEGKVRIVKAGVPGTSGMPMMKRVSSAARSRSRSCPAPSSTTYPR